MRKAATTTSIAILTAIALASCSSGVPGDAVASLGCQDGTLDMNLDHVDLEFGGLARSYELHVPAEYDGTTPMPLVVNFHGLTSFGEQQASFSNMSATADERGFIVAYPNGTENSWNAGTCCPSATTHNIDDVGFARAVVEDISSRGCIDSSRVYATGMSNGGFLTHRLACEAADIFAAAAPVAAVLLIDPEACTPSRPISIIHFHGTADSLVPYAGGGVFSFPSAAETHTGWAARNGCEGPSEVTVEQGTATCETFDQCDAGVNVTLCTLEGEGHCWPGQPVCPFGASTQDVSANDLMLDLFERMRLP